MRGRVRLLRTQKQRFGHRARLVIGWSWIKDLGALHWWIVWFGKQRMRSWGGLL